MLMPAPDPLILAKRADVLARLREAVPDGVIEDESSRRAYEQDALTAYRQIPMLVVLPSSTNEVAAVLRICSSMGVKVVPRGAGFVWRRRCRAGRCGGPGRQAGYSARGCPSIEVDNSYS